MVRRKDGKFMKKKIDEMASWQNGDQAICQFDKIPSDKMGSWKIGKLTKWQVDEMFSWQNVVAPKVYGFSICAALLLKVYR